MEEAAQVVHTTSMEVLSLEMDGQISIDHSMELVRAILPAQVQLLSAANQMMPAKTLESADNALLVEAITLSMEDT